MADNEQAHIRFEGHEGELLFNRDSAPALIELGDGSLWQFKNQVWTSEGNERFKKGYTFFYRPAKIEKIPYLHQKG